MAKSAKDRRARQPRYAGPAIAAMSIFTSLLGTGESARATSATYADDAASASVPAAARRAVRVFDFEEPDNQEAIPAGWARAQSQRGIDGNEGARSGFPEFNRAEFDFSVHRSGGASVRLPSRGGGVSLRLRPGELSIFPDADYIVTAWVQTSDVRHARAFLVARILDQRLNPIQGFQTRSVPVASSGGWTQVAVSLPSAPRDAAWLQIDLELLQPRQFLPARTGPAAQHAIWREDVDAQAWFDDVSVFQVPRAKLWTTAQNNVFSPGQIPLLWMMVRDLAGEPLSGRVSVFDAGGNLVDSQERTLDPGARPTSWQPRLAKFGWYRAVLDIRSNDEFISKAEVTLAHLAPWRLGLGAPGVSDSTGDRSRFGVAAELTPEATLASLPAMIREIGSGFVFIPAIDPTRPASQAADVMHNREDLYDQLLRLGQRVTLSISRVPDDLINSMTLDADDALGLCEHPASAWYPYFAPTLDVYGQRFVRYQVGRTGDGHAARRPPAAAFSRIEAALSGLVPNPSLAMSWRAEHAPPTIAREAVNDESLPAVRPVGAMIDAVTLAIPSSFFSGSIGELIRPWLSHRVEPGTDSTPELTIVLDLPDSAKYGGEAPVIELARRAIEAWAVMGAEGRAVLPARLAIDAPWSLGNHGSHPDALGSLVSPAPEMVCFRTLIDQLAGRRVVSTLQTSPGVKAFVLAAGVGRTGGLDDGCVIAWNENSPSQTVLIDVQPSGSKVSVTDVFGNRQLLDAPRPEESGAATSLLRVPVGESPVFIEGVDPYLAMFAASFKLDPAYIPAVVTEHEHTLHLSNPWPVRITGKLQLRDSESGSPFSSRTSSEDWTITPKGIIDFAIEPGESMELPVTISLGSAQVAGVRDFSVVAKVNADRQYPAIRLKTPVEIGLKSIELIPEARLSPGPDGPDVIVTATVTNTDTRSRVLRLEAAAANQATQQQQISNLAPGESIVRRFVFRNASRSLAGRRVFITLTEAEGTERLNKAVAVP